MAEELPPPPTKLPDIRTDDLLAVPAGSHIWRVYFAEGPHPGGWNRFRAWGPSARGRFDHHPPPAEEKAGLGIIYGAIGPEAVLTALAEVFQDTLLIDDLHNAPVLSALRLVAPLRLLDVTSGWITRASGNLAIAAGARKRAREWSRAIYKDYPDVPGLCWHSSVWPPGKAAALYERAAAFLPPAPEFNRRLADPALSDRLRDAADRLNYILRP